MTNRTDDKHRAPLEQEEYERWSELFDVRFQKYREWLTGPYATPWKKIYMKTSYQRDNFGDTAFTRTMNGFVRTEYFDR